MATLKDVAKLACVDVSTVSRALNNKSYVHPETKKKILKAVEQLGYSPNMVVKSLNKGKKHTIGVVMPNTNFSVFSDVVQGIEEKARQCGYSVLICNTANNPEVEKEHLERLRNGLVDGIIVTSTGKNNRLLQDINSSNIAVLQAIRLQDSSIDSVVADFFDCGYQSTKYLVKKGCKKIGFINGSLEVMPYRDRYKGYRKAIKKYGLEEFVHEATLPTTKYYADGFMGTKELLEKHPDLDSIMVAVDMQAMGAIRAIKKSGRKIPNDIRLISLTGHSIDSILETALTSMEIPAIEMGHYATEVIINLIESSEETKRRRQHIVFESTLRERETT